MSEVVKKTKVVPFVNAGTKEAPIWTQIKKSTTFTLSMNPQTKTYDFISSEIPQDELDSYKPSLSMSLTMYKGEPDYEVIFNMLYNRATGADAHKDVLIAFYKEKGTCNNLEGDIFKAWKVDSLVSINQMDTTNENIDFDLALNDVENGAVIIKDKKPVFVSGTWENETFIADNAENAGTGENEEAPATGQADDNEEAPATGQADDNEEAPATGQADDNGDTGDIGDNADSGDNGEAGENTNPTDPLDNADNADNG